MMPGALIQRNGFLEMIIHADASNVGIDARAVIGGSLLLFNTI
jgi:hypothetical protein